MEYAIKIKIGSPQQSNSPVKPLPVEHSFGPHASSVFALKNSANNIISNVFIFPYLIKFLII